MLLCVTILWSACAYTVSSQIGNSNDLSNQFPRKEVPREIECAVRYHSVSSTVESSEVGKKGVNHAQPPIPTIPNQRCECVPYYLCNQNRTISQDGNGLVDVRFSLLSGVGLVSTPPYSSCPCSNATSTTTPISQGVCSNYLDVCCSPPQPGYNDPPLGTPGTNEECGRRGKVRDLDIQLSSGQGKEGKAEYAEFPWMVAILGEGFVNGKTEKNVYLCGGSLIERNVVLTAAHCVKGMRDLTIRAGEHDTRTENEPYPTQERRVHHISIHVDYYAGTLFNDIALLFLESPLELAPNIATICLPEQGEKMDYRNCVASGWGKDVFGNEGKYQATLKKVELPILPRATCNRKFRSTRLGQYFNLHESFICAGGQNGQDTCKGDGGSPLVCPSVSDPQVFVQAGIVSWGIGCGGEAPGAYVNVAHFRSWIDSNTAMLTVDNRFGSLRRR